jgi:hypothetical protein
MENPSSKVQEWVNKGTRNMNHESGNMNQET